MTERNLPFPKPTAQVAPWFEVLGEDLIVPFLLGFGGAELRLGRDPKGRSRLEALAGHDRAKALAERDHLLPARVPLAKPWIAQVLFARGAPVAEIARTLHVTDITVRKWLRAAGMR